jgi:hypothetical protein
VEIGKAVTNALTLIGGISWTIVYLLIIIRSYKDKTYGMPFWALAFNISWELIFSFVLATYPLGLQEIINRVWLVFDIFILIAYFLFGRKEWPSNQSLKLFYPYSISVIITAYMFIYLISVELDHSQGMYAAFIQNLMMSWLFIAMLNNRRTTNGQSTGIAFFKLIGTLAPTIIYAVKSKFVLFLGAGCFVADLMYLVLLVHYRKGNH